MKFKKKYRIFIENFAPQLSIKMLLIKNLKKRLNTL